MIQQTMTEGQFDRIVTDLFGEISETAPAIQQANAARRRRQLHQLFAASETTTQIRGTRWAGFQAITEYIDHYAPARPTRWSPQEATTRAMRSIGTHGTEVRQRAYDLTRVNPPHRKAPAALKGPGHRRDDRGPTACPATPAYRYVPRWSPTHVLLHWTDTKTSTVHNAWVPTAWAQRIHRHESAWRDPHHQPA